jgi:hypothetical protein
MSGVTVFRPLKARRRVKLDELGYVISQMQGVLDTDPDPDDATALAIYGLVQQWHAMLQSALVDEAKR